MSATARLVCIKVLHTIVWAFFASCIVAILIAALLDWFVVAAALAVIVFVEVLVLSCNRMSCPLTAIAARYTSDRRPNFDIYLPEWLARYNKQIFGGLYVIGICVALGRWAWRR